MSNKKVDTKNQEILRKLCQHAKVIMKLYTSLINIEMSYNEPDNLIDEHIEKFLIALDEERLLYERYVNKDNIDILIRRLERNLKIDNSNIINNDISSTLIFARVLHHLIIKSTELKKQNRDRNHIIVLDLLSLYYTRILEDEAKKHPEKRALFVNNKYITYYLSPLIENMVIFNKFIANTDYPELTVIVNNKRDEKRIKDSNGQQLIEQEITNIEMTSYNSEDAKILDSIRLRAGFLIVDDHLANEIVKDYIIATENGTSKYNEKQELVVNAYHQSKNDRHKYIQNYISSPQDEVSDGIDETIDLLTERAKVIYKLYQKIICLKNYQDNSQEEIDKFLDYLRIAIDTELELHQKVIKDKSLSTKINMYSKLRNTINNINFQYITKFNDLFTNENLHPKIRVLSHFRNFILSRNQLCLDDCVIIISLMNLTKLLDIERESSIDNKYYFNYYKHLISYLNPEVENLTICTNFNGMNNYPNQLLEDNKADQFFKKEIAEETAQQLIDQIIRTNPQDQNSINMQCLYLRSILLLGDGFLINKIHKYTTSLYPASENLPNLEIILNTLNQSKIDQKTLKEIKVKEKKLQN